MVHVEPGEAGSGPSCPCCGLPGRSAFGFVHRGRESIAFYYAWLDPHRERRVVSLAISLGDWSQGGDPASRVAAAVQFESNGEDVSGRFLAPETSLFRHGGTDFATVHSYHGHRAQQKAGHLARARS